MTFDRITDLVRQRRVADLRLASAMNYAKNHYGELVGDGIDTWYDFLKQPEIGLTQPEANYLIKLWDLHVHGDLSEDDIAMIPTPTMKVMLRNGGDLDDAKTLTTTDFKERYYEKKVGDDAPRTYTYMVMKRCNETGNLSKVHGVESEEVEETFKEKIEDGRV